MGNRYNSKKKYQICLCGVKHGSIPSLAACERFKRSYTSSCRGTRLLEEKSSYDPAQDMCKIQSPQVIVMDPVKNVNQNYATCKQAVGMQNLADRRYSASQCQRGKPCALRNRYNSKKKYQICLCGVKHGSI